MSLEKTLERQVARALGFQGDTFDPTQVHRYLDPEAANRASAAFKEQVWLGIESGNLRGRLALQAYRQAYGQRTLYHGSPLARTELEGGVLEPRPPRWYDEHGEMYAAGEPAVCASRDFNFPILRAMLHNDSPVLAGERNGVVLSSRRTPQGRAAFFTSESVLSALRQNVGPAGYVHVLSRDSDARCDRPYYDPVRRRTLEDEFRIFKSVRPLLSVPVGPEDLPDDLVVINADLPAAGEMLALVPQVGVVQAGRQTGVPARPLGGVWPLAEFPHLAGK